MANQAASLMMATNTQAEAKAKVERMAKAKLVVDLERPPSGAKANRKVLENDST